MLDPSVIQLFLQLFHNHPSVRYTRNAILIKKKKSDEEKLSLHSGWRVSSLAMGLAFRSSEVSCGPTSRTFRSREELTILVMCCTYYERDLKQIASSARLHRESFDRTSSFVDFVTEKLIKTMMEVQESLVERHVSLLPREITFVSDPATNLSAFGFKLRNRRSVLRAACAIQPLSYLPALLVLLICLQFV